MKSQILKLMVKKKTKIPYKLLNSITSKHTEISCERRRSSSLINERRSPSASLFFKFQRKVQ